jgi:pimeloyl-ACP methyl ester carboxylesterase
MAPSDHCTVCAVVRLPVIGVGTVDPPLELGETTLGDGRRMCWATFGDPYGTPVLWFHGTPGGQTQIPPATAREAAALGIKIVCVARPGVGRSSDVAYASFRHAAQDIAAVADDVGARRFGIVALSGGGPYAFACGHELPHRVEALAILGGVCPVTGPDASPGGIVGLAARFNSVLGVIRAPLGDVLRGVIGLLGPVSHPAYRGFARLMPKGDQRVFADPEIEAMFVRDLVAANRHSFRGIVNDVVLFGRDWGFRLSEVDVPVRWWHGDADSLVPLEHARHASSLLPDCELLVRPEESHLGGFGVAGEVLSWLAEVADSARYS